MCADRPFGMLCISASTHSRVQIFMRFSIGCIDFQERTNLYKTSATPSWSQSFIVM